MERQRFERRIIAGLLILLCVEISLLVLHLTWGGFRPRHVGLETALAGEVATNEHEVRRRSLNSLVWEKSSTHDPIYYYDSVLTLAQSTASLKLFKDTDLKLSENTLVTIEPPSDDRHGEIRLLFHKGGFKARNPYAVTKVEGENWSMEIGTGSEVDLRQAGTENYELQVTKGEVDFKSANGDQHIGKDQVLRIDPKTSQQLEILPDDALHWVEPPAKRIYTLKKEVELTLHWQGLRPTQLVRQTLGGEEGVLPLNGESFETTVTLPLGHHSLYLRSEGKSSQALEVEIWTAPLIHLVSPLPRDRIKTSEPVTFVWTWRPEVANFHFHLKGAKSEIAQKQTDNTFTTQFEAEDTANWSVEGEDKDGFIIPAPYSYPIYIREAPLAAPHLKSPVIRKPAKDDGASYWWRLDQWLLPEAQAGELNDYQAVFQWEPVERADRYVIEISETPDFRTPIVTQNLDKNEFIWRKVELKTYYWRVAAESKRGQMGFFSEPEKVDLKDIHSKNVKVTKMKPVKEKIEPPPVVEAPPPAPPPEPPPVAPVANEAPPPPVDHYRVELRPRYESINGSNSEDVRAKFQGIDMMDIGAHADLRIESDKTLRFDFEFAQEKYQPSPKEDFPAQKDLSWMDLRTSTVIHTDNKSWGYGGTLQTSTQFIRETYSSINSRTGILLGPTLENWQKWKHLQYYGDYSLLIGTEYGASIGQHLRRSIDCGFVGGVSLEAQYVIHSGGNTTSLTGQFTLGFEF